VSAPTSAAARACDACLRRTWLIAALAGHVEKALSERRRIPQVLALPDADLIAALAGPHRAQLEAAYDAFDPIDARARIQGLGLQALCRHDSRYPEPLARVPDAPAVLHCLGGLDRLLELLDAPAVAIVGARRASPYGLEVAQRLGRGLAGAGVTVVSGMALGVDSAAHTGALESTGTTVAVLGGGAERPYPATKRSLHRAIAARGAVISELPPGCHARRWCFPARNRIIAALAQLTVVVEATDRSGSLITAEFARALGRDVAAVPGRVTSSLARGANALIADGAHLVSDAQDVLDLLFGVGAVHARPERDAAQLDAGLRDLLEAVGNGTDTVAALTSAGADARETLQGLAELELLGYVACREEGRYVPLA
jgi:DNA processing protein